MERQGEAKKQKQCQCPPYFGFNNRSAVYRSLPGLTFPSSIVSKIQQAFLLCRTNCFSLLTFQTMCNLYNGFLWPHAIICGPVSFLLVYKHLCDKSSKALRSIKNTLYISFTIKHFIYIWFIIRSGITELFRKKFSYSVPCVNR